jgi:hypothetical protein
VNGSLLGTESERGKLCIGLEKDDARQKRKMRMQERVCRTNDAHEHVWVMSPALPDDPDARLEQGLCPVPWSV